MARSQAKPTFGAHAVLLAAGLALAMLLVWKLADILLVAFGAVIIAVVLRSIADPLRRRTGMPEAASVLVAVLLVAGVIGGSGWLFGATVRSEVATLMGRLPQSMDELRALVSTLPFGDGLAGLIGSAAPGFDGLAGRIGGYASTLAGAVTNAVLVLFIGIHLALSPRVVRDGVLSLLPDRTAGRIGEALNSAAGALKAWLMGTLADMVVVGVMTGAGLALIGLPSAMALGLLAGVAAFVPIVGPVLSVIPGVLLALQQGPEMVLWTLLVYVVVQQVESNLIYPYIQRRAVDLHPVLALSGLLVMGGLLGPLGVAFATPILVIAMVFVKLLYLRDVRGREVSLPGQSA